LACNCGGRGASLARLSPSGEIRPATGPIHYIVEGGAVATPGGERYTEATAKAAGFKSAVEQARVRAKETGARIRSVRG
jgi:hypothetical protein